MLLPDQGERVSGGKTTGVTPLLERERREWEERGTEREAEWEGEQRKKREREIEAKREGKNQTDTDRQIHLKNLKYIFSINFLPFEKKEYRGKLSLPLLMYRFIFSLTK